MASHAPHHGRASTLTLSAVLASIPSYPRPVVERLVARLIERLDEQDGDPDMEHDPFDEAEPSFNVQSRALVNKHPNTDPNGDNERAAWIERVDQTTPALADEPAMPGSHEDAEDDDPSGQCDEDGINTGPGHLFVHGKNMDGPGCQISDAGEWNGQYD